MLDTAVNDLIATTRDKQGMPPLVEYTTNSAKWYHQAPIDEIIRIANDAKAIGNKALDIGCGYGTLSIIMASLGFDVTAIDYYYPAIPWQIRQKMSISMQICDIERDDVPGCGYSIIVMMEVIEHLNFSPRHIMQQLSEKILKGGYFILGTPNNKEWGELGKHWREIDGSGNGDPFHTKHYSLEEVEDLMSEYGFAIDRSVIYRDNKHILMTGKKI